MIVRRLPPSWFLTTNFHGSMPYDVNDPWCERELTEECANQVDEWFRQIGMDESPEIPLFLRRSCGIEV